jgi:hypothetical protein
MTDEQDPDEGPTLTDIQRARIEFAHRDLESARGTDLGSLPPDRLILLVEMLRRRLDDTLNLITEITSESPNPQR